jgi:hypothetical protein
MQKHETSRPKVVDRLPNRNRHHPGAFELRLTGPAVWVLAIGVAALLQALAQHLLADG